MRNARLACPQAVCRKKGITTYLGGGQQGGTLDTLTKSTIKERHYGDLEGSKVDCDTMSGVIRNLNGHVDPPVLHFWSLDCEGCEDVALESFDWDNTEVAVLLVELEEGKNCGGHVMQCQQILRDRGMKQWSGLGNYHDEIWYSKKYFSQAGRNAPVSPADSAMVGSWVVLAELFTIFVKHVTDDMHDSSET